MSALLPIINRLILQSPDSRSELTSFAGKTLTLNIAGLKLAGRITEDGLLSAGNGFADTEITFRNSAIQKILQGGEPGAGDIRLEGDLILGIAVLSLLGSLRSRASDELARIFGTQAGRHRQPCHRHRTRHQTNRQEHRRTNRRIFPRTRVRKHRQRSPCRLPRRNKQTARRRGTPQRTPRQARTRHLDRLTFRRHPT